MKMQSYKDKQDNFAENPQDHMLYFIRLEVNRTGMLQVQDQQNSQWLEYCKEKRTQCIDIRI